MSPPLTPLPATASDELRLLQADVLSLRVRVQRRKPSAREEIIALLELADPARPGGPPADAVAGRAIYAKAESRFVEDVQAKNRLLYASGMLLGLTVMLLVAIGLVTLAKANSFNLAERDTLVSLFAFAGLGSVTSFLTRLPTLALREESSRKLVLVSGAARPLVAIGLASVVYLILRYRIINLQVGESGGGDGAAAVAGNPEERRHAQQALWWIAAFLCGFSERFAHDLLGRLPFLTDDVTAEAEDGAAGAAAAAGAR